MAAYFLFDNVEVTDPAALRDYAKEASRLVAEHGGRYLVTAVTPEVVEGDPPPRGAEQRRVARGLTGSRMPSLRHAERAQVRLCHASEDRGGEGTGQSDADTANDSGSCYVSKVDQRLPAAWLALGTDREPSLWRSSDGRARAR